MGQTSQCCSRSQDLHTDDKESPEDLPTTCGENAPAPKLERKKVTFDRRPFGITPLRGPWQTGYVVEAVNKKDASKPAWQLGVRPGWIGLSVNGNSIESMKIDAIHALLKEAPLPLVFEFSVPSTRQVVLSFDSRPFGMTACKSPGTDAGRQTSNGGRQTSNGGHDDPTVGYEVDSVNSDASRPACALGVQPGWVLQRIGKTRVSKLRLMEIHRLLKESPLPAELEFAAPEIPHLAEKGGSGSEVASNASTAAPEANAAKV